MAGVTWELELMDDHRFVRRFENATAPSDNVTVEGTWTLVEPAPEPPTWRDRLGLASPRPVALFATLTLEYRVPPGGVVVHETYRATAKATDPGGRLTLADPDDPIDGTRVSSRSPREMPRRFERAN
jgi:hypothetical protein